MKTMKTKWTVKSVKSGIHVSYPCAEVKAWRGRKIVATFWVYVDDDDTFATETDQGNTSHYDEERGFVVDDISRHDIPDSVIFRAQTIANRAHELHGEAYKPLTD